MSFLANLAAYAVLLGTVIRLAGLVSIHEKLLQAYRHLISAQVELISALREENFLLKQEKALSAHADQAPRIEAPTAPEGYM